MAELRTESRTEWTSDPRETGDRNLPADPGRDDRPGHPQARDPHALTFALLHAASPHLHLCTASLCSTEPLSLRPLICIPCQLANWSTNLSYTPYSILPLPTFAPLHAAPPHLHLCTAFFWSTEPMSLRASDIQRYLPCQRVNLPACPLAQARVPMSPYPRVPYLIIHPSSSIPHLHL